MSAEVREFLSEDDARRLTERIGILLDAASGTLDKLADAIREARDGRADLALGYASWADYASAEFAPHTAGLTASIRRELVATLSVDVDGSPALSTRQIAPAVGTDFSTVSRDRQVLRDATPDAELIPPFDPTTGEMLDDAPGSTIATDSGTIVAEQRHVDAPRTVLGLDGKTYTRHVPRPDDKAPREGIRTNVVVQINKVLNAAEEAAGHASAITKAHLANRQEEATVWTRRLSAAIEELDRLNTSLQEASR